MSLDTVVQRLKAIVAECQAEEERLLSLANHGQGLDLCWCANLHALACFAVGAADIATAMIDADRFQIAGEDGHK